MNSEPGNTSRPVSSPSRSGFLCRDVVLALGLAGNPSQLAHEMSHVSGDGVTGPLRAETFPEGRPLQPRSHRTAPRGLGRPDLGFIAVSLRPKDGTEPPPEPACCRWAKPGLPWGWEGCAPRRPCFLRASLSPRRPVQNSTCSNEKTGPRSNCVPPSNSRRVFSLMGEQPEG